VYYPLVVAILVVGSGFAQPMTCAITSRNVSETTGRNMPNIVCLKIETAKKRISLHINENILIVFNFQWGTQICDQNHHMRLGTPTAKNSKLLACHLEKAHWNHELARTLNM